MLSPSAQNRFRSVAASIIGPPVIALRNLASTVQSVSVLCLKEGPAPADKTWLLAPNQTKLVKACTSGEDDSIEPGAQIFSDAQPDHRESSVGISVESSAPPASLAVYGLARHTEGGYEPLPFVQTGVLHSSAAVFNGVPVGTTNQLSSMPFEPYVGFANFGAKPAHASITYASTSSSNEHASHQVSVPVIPPYTSLRIPVSNLAGNADLQNSFIVTADGEPGQVLFTMESEISDTGLWIDSPNEDLRKDTNGGQHPWQLTDEVNSYLLLFNSDKVG